MTQSRIPVGCVVMAAGNASRFGSNKLLAEVRGKSLLRRALEAVPREELDRAVLVTQYDAAAELGRFLGFQVIRNDRPDLGQSYTVRLGTGALAESCGGILYMTADQPLLRRETAGDLVRFWRRDPASIAGLAHGGKRGNPCIFARRFFPELLALTGDRGGSPVIGRHPEALRLLEAAEEELRDVDTLEEWRRLEAVGDEE